MTKASASLPQELIDRSIYRRGTLAVFDRIEPKKTALMVIDMQNAWLVPGAPFHTPPTLTIVPAINCLVDALRSRGGLVAWFRHTTGAPGTDTYWGHYFENFVSADKRGEAIEALLEGSWTHDVYSGFDVRAEDLVLPKYRFSAFLKNTVDVEKLFRERGIDTVIVVGTATNVGCESTIRDAMMLDFKTFMPHDAVVAAYEDGHLASMRSVMQTFADVRPVDELIEIMGE